jgi:hypothetical protein
MEKSTQKQQITTAKLATKKKAIIASIETTTTTEIRVGRNIQLEWLSKVMNKYEILSNRENW